MISFAVFQITDCILSLFSDAMNTTKPILFLEGEDKASSGGGVGFDSEMAQPSAVVTPNGKFIASKEADEAVIATVGTDVEMSLQPLAPPVDKIVEGKNLLWVHVSYTRFSTFSF